MIFFPLNNLGSSSNSNVGIPPCGYRISNLFFVDDCLIFSKATKKASRNILHVLNQFSKASGQRINFHKSTIYFSTKVENRVNQEISNLLGIQHKTSLGKYLGIHNLNANFSSVAWKDICVPTSKAIFFFWQELPKQFGGLEIRPSAFFNLTMRLWLN